MRPVRSLLIYLGAVFVLGALLAPWLYWLMEWLAGFFPSLQKLAHSPFHRFVHRSILGVALLGSWPLVRSLGVQSWSAVGVVKPTGQWRRLATGFALGFCSLASVALLALAAGARRPDPDYSAASLWTAGLVALGVGSIEEILFRGTLMGALGKAQRWPWPLTISSVMYALSHFFQEPKTLPAITWKSGFDILRQMSHGFTDAKLLMPGFLVLTLAGLVLGLAYHRTGNLYYSVGLHAGWIFWHRSYRILTDATPNANSAFWGTAKLLDGWLALVILAGVWLVVWFLVEKKPHGPKTTETTQSSRSLIL